MKTPLGCTAARPPRSGFAMSTSSGPWILERSRGRRSAAAGIFAVDPRSARLAQESREFHQILPRLLAAYRRRIRTGGGAM